MRSFVIESNGNYLGECEDAEFKLNSEQLLRMCDTSYVDVNVVYNGERRLVRIVNVSDPEGETLIPPHETEPVKAVVYYGVRV